ncbi:MAG: aminopeptidase N [Burkholderiaceae bacterium]|nr:aminopeptidase N [Burkholderiaceae bacterium]
MPQGTATLVRREDYAPPPYRIRHVELGFDLDPAKTIVASRLHLERAAGTAAGTPLALDGEGLNLLRVMSDGASVSFRHEGDKLVIDQPPADEAFVLEIRATCAPDRNTALSGLYASGSGLFTQCEAEGFRRITYFLDRPDVMATYRVTLRADRTRYPVLLANGNLVEQGELDGGRHFAVWDDPFPKPSYLFALVAADLVAREQRIRTRGGRDHLLQVWVKRGDLDKTGHAMRSLVASVAWDEARFGLPLDLDRFMIVAVDDFNMGAMENKGLNVFNTKYVLASPVTATDDDFAGIESVVGHEYFHNWTGNRVTCRDWFQLSLKEGLTVFRDQEFSMDMAGGTSARAVKRIEDVRALRHAQFAEDAGPMAHPVRPDAYAAIDNFYTATVYEKGAEVVRMMHTLVGREGFARGMTMYFERHDGQAVTCDDFARAIADANPGSPLAAHFQAFGRWYAQAGTPRLKARGQWDAAAQRYTLTLAQQHLPSPGQPHKQPMVIPVRTGLVGRDGTSLAEELLVLTETEQVFTFDGIAAEPVPSLLRGFSAPVILDDALDDDALRVLLAHDGDAFVRWEAGQRLALRRMLAALPAGASDRLDDAFVDAMRAVLRHDTLDPAFKALALTLPGEAYVAEQAEPFDPLRIHAVRESMRDQLAHALADDWAWAWDAHQVREGYAPTPDQAGRRALANLALAMQVRRAERTGDPVWPGRAYQRVKDASSMTDREAALRALVAAGSPLASQALGHFHARFRHDALVVDKWFAIQATAPEPAAEGTGRVLAHARTLLAHPDFSLRNPNRARSLIFALCHGNPAALHRPDASGYRFWAEQLLALDGFNPQVASRLARAMDRWRALAEPWRSAAREAIARVAARPELSDEVREIVSRALEND